jgi:O-antigen/teichoic acid export membrane protein
MNRSVTFARNTAVQIVGRVISTALGVVGVALIARYLGTAGYGHYSTVTAFLQLVAILADFGLYLTLLHELGSTPEHEHAWRFGSGLTLRLITGAIVFALAPLIALTFPYPAEIKAGIALAAAGYWFNQIATLLGVVFQQRMRMAWAAAADTLGRVAFIAAVLWVIHANAGLMGILAANVLNSVVWVAILWVCARRLVQFKLAIDWKHWLATLAKAWPIGLGIGFNLVYFKADTVILSLYRSAEEVGLYGAAYRVLEILSTLPHIVMGLALPIMASLWAARDTAKLGSVVQKLFDVFWLMVWPIVAGLIVISTPVMALVAGPEFLASGPILRVLSLGTGAIFFGTLFGYVVLVTEQQKRMLWAYGSVAVVGMAAYLLLIPQLSYWAAAWTTVGVEVSIALAALGMSRRRVALPLQWNVCAKAGLAALAMALLLYIIGPMNALVLTAIGGVVYGCLLLVLGVVPRDFLRSVLAMRQ